MSMILRPRPGTRVRIFDGALENMTGTVIAMNRGAGKVIIRIDSPDTWCGERQVKVHRRKLRRISRRWTPPHP